MGRVEPSNT